MILGELVKAVWPLASAFSEYCRGDVCTVAGVHATEGDRGPRAAHDDGPARPGCRHRQVSPLHSSQCTPLWFLRSKSAEMTVLHGQGAVTVRYWRLSSSCEGCYHRSRCLHLYLLSLPVHRAVFLPLLPTCASTVPFVCRRRTPQSGRGAAEQSQAQQAADRLAEIDAAFQQIQAVTGAVSSLCSEA